MDLPRAFHFAVRFGTDGADVDASFQEVGGIGAELETESVQEGGENRFVHQLPKGVKNTRLTLKRGLVPIDSKLVQWCKLVLEGGLAQPIETKEVQVMLLDREGGTLRHWSFTNAYPVKWSVEGFAATKNEVAVEQLELNYSVMTRKK
jgi:phage tail-like protein